MIKRSAIERIKKNLRTEKRLPLFLKGSWRAAPEGIKRCTYLRSCADDSIRYYFN